MRYAFDDAERRRRAQDAVLLDARLARHLARGLEGRHHAPDDRRLEPLQRRRRGSCTTPTSTAPSCTTWPRRTRTSSGSSRTSGSRRPARNGAFPLDDRSPLEIILTPRPLLAPPRDRYVYFPGTADVPEQQAVNIRNRSFAIGALVDIPAAGAEGVLFAHGARFGGHALYVKENRLHYVNSFVGIVEQKIDATEDLPTGEDLILVGLVREGRRGPARRRHRDPVPLPRRQEGRRGPDQDPAGLLLARRRGPVRRPRQRRGRHRRLPGHVAAHASPAARSSASPSTSAASPTSTWSARRRRCWRASERLRQARTKRAGAAMPPRPSSRLLPSPEVGYLDVMGGESFSAVTAINVLIEPDEATRARARELNARLRLTMPEGFALDATHVPHITVLQRYVRTPELDQVAGRRRSGRRRRRPLSADPPRRRDRPRRVGHAGHRHGEPDARARASAARAAGQADRRGRAVRVTRGDGARPS